MRFMLMVSLLSAVALPAVAAKPVSIAFKQLGYNHTGQEYSVYDVECSNGSNVDITAWNNRKLWCQGDKATEQNCDKKQIKAAKRACTSIGS